MASELPHDLTGSHDILRQGLATFKSDALPSHPVETLQKERLKFHNGTKKEMQANLYGSAFGVRNDLERQILSKFQRPPGLLPSSMLGFEALTGSLDDLKFDQIFYDPRDSSSFAPVDMHDGLEARLGISKAPPSRAFV